MPVNPQMTGIQPVNIISALDPDIYAEQLKLQRAQMLANALTSEAFQPSGGTQFTGGPYSHPISNPWGPLAKIGQAYFGNKMWQGIPEEQGKLASREMALANAILNPGGGQPTGQVSQAPQMGAPQMGSQENPNGIPGWATTDTPQTPQPSQPQTQQSVPLGPQVQDNPYLKMAVLNSIYGPAAAQFYAQKNMPTDLQKNIDYSQKIPGAPTPAEALKHALSPPISTRYGIYDVNGNPIGGALPPNALPFVRQPNGQMGIGLYPGQPEAEQALREAGARGEAAGQFPSKTTEVTTASGQRIPALVSSFTGNPYAQPQAQSPVQSTSQQPHPSVAAVGAALNAAKSPPTGGQGGLQTTAGEAYQKASGTSGSEYQDELRKNATEAVTQNRMLDELAKATQDFGPGKLAAWRKAIAEWEVQAGSKDPEVQKIAASGEVGDKLTGQLVSNALRKMSARPSQMEFQIFLTKFVPNMNMTPQGAQAVLQFMRQQNNLDLQKNEAFKQWRQGKNPEDYRDFEIDWAKKAGVAPLQSPASYPLPQPVPGQQSSQPSNVIDWNKLGR